MTELTFAQRYQLIKEINEQTHAMVNARTVSSTDVWTLQRVAAVQAEILLLESQQQLAAAKAPSGASEPTQP